MWYHCHSTQCRVHKTALAVRTPSTGDTSRRQKKPLRELHQQGVCVYSVEQVRAPLLKLQDMSLDTLCSNTGNTRYAIVMGNEVRELNRVLLA